MAYHSYKKALYHVMSPADSVCLCLLHNVRINIPTPGKKLAFLLRRLVSGSIKVILVLPFETSIRKMESYYLNGIHWLFNKLTLSIRTYQKVTFDISSGGA